MEDLQRSIVVSVCGCQYQVCGCQYQEPLLRLLRKRRARNLGSEPPHTKCEIVTKKRAGPLEQDGQRLYALADCEGVACRTERT